MKLYKNSDGVWAGTQADARKMCGKDYSTVDVPTDKPSLLKFLNFNQVGSHTSNDKTDTHYEVYVPSEHRDNDLDSKALSYFAWGYDKLCSGQYDEGKELIRKALLNKNTRLVEQIKEAKKHKRKEEVA